MTTNQWAVVIRADRVVTEPCSDTECLCSIMPKSRDTNTATWHSTFDEAHAFATSIVAYGVFDLCEPDPADFDRLAADIDWWWGAVLVIHAEDISRLFDIES